MELLVPLLVLLTLVNAGWGPYLVVLGLLLSICVAVLYGATRIVVTAAAHSRRKA